MEFKSQENKNYTESSNFNVELEKDYQMGYVK